MLGVTCRALEASREDRSLGKCMAHAFFCWKLSGKGSAEDELLHNRLQVLEAFHRGRSHGRSRGKCFLAWRYLTMSANPAMLLNDVLSSESLDSSIAAATAFGKGWMQARCLLAWWRVCGGGCGASLKCGGNSRDRRAGQTGGETALACIERQIAEGEERMRQIKRELARPIVSRRKGGR